MFNRQRRNLILSIFIIFSFLLAGSVPVLGMANYTPLTNPFLIKNTTYDVATGNPARIILQVQVPEVSFLFTSGDTFSILVDNIEFSHPGSSIPVVSNSTIASTSPYAIYLPPTISGVPNALAASTINGTITASKMADISVIPSAGATGSGGFYIYLNNIKALDKEGDIKLNILAPANSGFTPATVSFSGNKYVFPINNNPDQNPVKPEPVKPKTIAKFTLNAAAYSVNSVTSIMDVRPYEKENRVYIPVRYLAYTLGLTDQQINWNPSAQTVTLVNGSDTLILKVNSKSMIKNENIITMDAAPELSHGRLMLPVRWVSEAFGADVVWDPVNLTVTISY